MFIYKYAFKDILLLGIFVSPYFFEVEHKSVLLNCVQGIRASSLSKVVGVKASPQ